jgi:hypothetical protein
MVVCSVVMKADRMASNSAGSLAAYLVDNTAAYWAARSAFAKVDSMADMTDATTVVHLVEK